LTLQAHWKNFVDLRRTSPSADLVGSCVVFNIGGNEYRLIGKIDYELQTVNVRFALTHRDYSRNSWKADC
jgi:mRNA interferase HigB